MNELLVNQDCGVRITNRRQTLMTVLSIRYPG